jgi:RNA polymerase sigma factor (sigma-70 family)
MGLDVVAEDVEALQGLLDRVKAGEPDAWEGLIRLVDTRYRKPVHLKLQRDNPRVACFERTDDVLQHVSLRLLSLLHANMTIVPTTVSQFERWLPSWVATTLRFVLTDLARKHLGTNRRAHLEYGATHEDPVIEQTSGEGGQRAHVHVLIGLLPEDERQVIELRYYLEQTYSKIGRLLDIDRRVVQRIEGAALFRLGKWLREGYRAP